MQVRYFFLVHINNNSIILNVVACIIYANISNQYISIDCEQSLNFLYRSVGGVFMRTTQAATRNYA